MSDLLDVGTAKVDITPQLTVPYLGWEPRHALFEGVHDPLYARALAVDDGQTPVVLIAVDAIGYDNDILGSGRNFTAEVRQRVQAQTGVPAGHVMLAASHAHSTPETIHFRRLLDTPSAGPWLETLIEQLASAASMAVRGRRPSTLKVGTGEVRGLARNRCSEPSPGHEGVARAAIDPRVGMLLFQAMGEDSCILVTSFACHPVTVQVQPLVSADFPGVAMALVERTVPGCQGSLFLQGACGDQNPARDDTRDFQDVMRYGLMLGGEAIKQVGRLSAPDYPPSPPLVRVASEALTLPGREVLSHEALQAAHDELDRRLARAVSEEERQRCARERRMVEEAQIQARRAEQPIVGEVQVFRLGDAALVGWPGEPFVELGLEVQERAAAPYAFMVGYANGYLGYFATAAAWEQRIYEVGNGPWARAGQAASSMLVDKSVELVAQLWA
jgi:hypothetical protein